MIRSCCQYPPGTLHSPWKGTIVLPTTTKQDSVLTGRGLGSKLTKPIKHPVNYEFVWGAWNLLKRCSSVCWWMLFIFEEVGQRWPNHDHSSALKPEASPCSARFLSGHCLLRTRLQNCIMYQKYPKISFTATICAPTTHRRSDMSPNRPLASRKGSQRQVDSDQIWT